MPVGLRNAERERLLGRMWKALSKTEKRARKAQASSVAAVAAPTPAATCPSVAINGAEEMLGDVSDATSQSRVMPSAESESAPAATTTKFVWQASLEKARRLEKACHTALHIAWNLQCLCLNPNTRFTRRAYPGDAHRTRT